MAALRDEVGVQGRQVTVGVVANGGVVAVGDGHAVRGDFLGQKLRLQMPPRSWACYRSVWDDVDRVGQASHGATVTPARSDAEHRAHE